MRTSTLKTPSAITSSQKLVKQTTIKATESKTIPNQRIGAGNSYLSKSYIKKPSERAAIKVEPPKKIESAKKDFLHARRSTIVNSPQKSLDKSESSKGLGTNSISSVSSRTFGSKGSVESGTKLKRLQFSSHQEKVISEQKIKVEVVNRPDDQSPRMEMEQEDTPLRTKSVILEEAPKSFKEKLEQKRSSMVEDIG